MMEATYRLRYLLMSVLNWFGIITAYNINTPAVTNENNLQYSLNITQHNIYLAETNKARLKNGHPFFLHPLLFGYH